MAITHFNVTIEKWWTDDYQDKTEKVLSSKNLLQSRSDLNPRLQGQKPATNDLNYSNKHEWHYQQLSFYDVSCKNKNGIEVFTAIQTFVLNVILTNGNKPQDKSKATRAHSKTQKMLTSL
jgi:hypothetical protein